MAFLETRTERLVLQGIGKVNIVLEEAVKAGDPIGISATPGWVPSISATVEQPVLIAGEDGKAGEEITAYMMAVVKAITAAGSQATIGEKVAVADTGAYASADTELPDVGFVAKCTGSSTLAGYAILFLAPMHTQLTVVRA